MKTLINNTKKFLRDEDGMEFLQWVIIIVISVALIAVMWLLRDAIAEIIQGAVQALKDMWSRTGSGSISGGGGGGAAGGVTPEP